MGDDLDRQIRTSQSTVMMLQATKIARLEAQLAQALARIAALEAEKAGKPTMKVSA